MTDTQTLPPTPDERVMAALAHISVLLPLIGVISPIVIWISQKDKSRYVAFQSLQALAYQLAIIVAWFLSMGCYMVSFFGTFFGLMLTAAGETRQASEIFAILATLVPLLVLGAVFVIGFVLIIYGVIGAILAFQGKPFRYALIGKRVEHFMQGDTPAADPGAA